MWNGGTQGNPNWSGSSQFSSGGEILYTTPDPATTTTNPSIGIVDGNEIPLPTAYNTLDVDTLTSGTINNSGTITTDDLVANTINGNSVPVGAEYWANYEAINNIVARDGPRAAYVPNLWYAGVLGLSNVSYGSPYLNYNTAIAGKGLNPGNRLDPFDVNVNYSAFQPSTGATYNGVQYISLNNNTIPAIAPPDPTYWRLAEYQNLRTYTTGELTFHAASNAWYTSIAGSTGQAPPNATYWNVFQRWTVITSPSISSNYWNISNFNNISSNILTAPTGNITQVNAYTVNAADGNVSGEWRPDTLISRVANVSSILNVGSSGPLGDGGTFKIGYDCLNPISTPAVTIGNSTINKCSVEIFGESNITANNALLVHGGFTVVAGPLGTTVPGSLQNHGISLNAAQVAGVSSVTYTQDLLGLRMVTVLPTQPIQITARAGILELTSQLLGTYIAANTGLYVSQSSGSYGGGRIFTDHICPGYTSGNVLLINGRNDLTSGVTGVQIDNGTTWNTTTLNATTINSTTENATDLNVSGTAIINNLVAVDTTAEEVSTLTFVNIPESQTLPPDWDTGNTYELNALVVYAPTGTLYFSLGSGNQGNDPSTSPTFWLVANWNVATTYSVGDPTFVVPTQSFWTSLQNSNTGNFPIIPAEWDSAVTYPIGDTVLYQEQHFQSLQNGNLSHFPDEVGSVWWTNIPIYWELNTNSYNIGNTNTGLVFTPVVSGFTGITTLVKRFGDPDEELNVVVKNPQGVELSAQSVVVSPMYKTFDMGNQDITNVKDITAAGNISITAPTGNSYLTASGTMNVESVGGVTLNSSTANVAISAQQGITITSSASSVILEAATGSNVEIQSPLDMSNFNIIGANTLTGTGPLTLATLSNGNLNLSPNGTGIIEANKGIDMNDNTIVGASTITGTTALTLATTGNNNLNLSPAGTGLIEANKSIDMNNNTIVGASTITGTTTLTLASTGNSNINISPAGTGQVVINKQVNFSSQTLFNMTLTNVDGVYSRPTGALVLVSQQAVSPAVQIRGALTMWANQTTQAPGNSIAGLTTLTGQTTLGLATLSNGDLSLSPNGTGTIIANKTLNMNNNNIINANTITGQGALTLTTSSNNNLFLSADGSGQVILQRPMSMNGNSLQANYIFTTGSMSVVAGSGAAVTLTAPGGSIVVDATYLNMSNNQIINVSQINSRNLFAYGNFYNTATQTLGAINTATRIQMNTSLNNNLITLDTTTNIGRITFTNAGVYHVVWNAYLFHASGGTAKSVVWIRLNGTDVAGSGKTENNDSQQNETNMTSSSMVSVTAGQYIEFYWAANGTNVPLTAIAASSPYPATPSFSCTISIVG